MYALHIKEKVSAETALYGSRRRVSTVGLSGASDVPLACLSPSRSLVPNKAVPVSDGESDAAASSSQVGLQGALQAHGQHRLTNRGWEVSRLQNIVSNGIQLTHKPRPVNLLTLEKKGKKLCGHTEAAQTSANNNIDSHCIMFSYLSHDNITCC